MVIEQSLLFEHAGFYFSAAVLVADFLSPCYRYVYTRICVDHTQKEKGVVQD